MTEPNNAFISYRRKNVRWVERLAHGLMVRNLNIWFDKWSLIAGESFHDGIQRGMAASQCCLVCIGKAELDGWCKDEVGLALNRSNKDPRFRVIPVLMPKGNRRLIDGFLGGRHYVEFRSGMDDAYAWHVLISAVKGVPPGPGPSYQPNPVASELTGQGSMRYLFQLHVPSGQQRSYFELKLDSPRVLKARHEQSDAPTPNKSLRDREE